MGLVLFVSVYKSQEELFCPLWALGKCCWEPQPTEIQRWQGSISRPQVSTWERKWTQEWSLPSRKWGDSWNPKKPVLIFKHQMLHIPCSKFSVVVFSLNHLVSNNILPGLPWGPQEAFYLWYNCQGESLVITYSTAYKIIVATEPIT